MPRPCQRAQSVLQVGKTLGRPMVMKLVHEAVPSLHWRSLDDEWVVFAPDQGVVTALDAFHATVLDSVVSGASSAEGVARMLASETRLPSTPAITTRIAQALAHLASAGLVQPAARSAPSIEAK